MLIATALMSTLLGPTPTPFTGDPVQALHFLDDFEQLARANRRHVLVSRPKLRVELALTFIVRNTTTASWRRVARRQSRDSGSTDETVWDSFFDSFCTAWIDPPVPSAATSPRSDPPPRPARSPRRASPVTAILDSVKPADELPPIPATAMPPPRPAPGSDGVIDLTDTDLEEWALSAPRTELTQTPRSPRAVSPTASILDSVKPVDESPRPPVDLPLHAHAKTNTTAENENEDEDGSYKRDMPLVPLPVEPTLVVEDDNKPTRGVKTLGTSVFAPGFTFSHPVSPVLPPQTPVYNIYDSPCRVMPAPIPRKRPREPDDTADRERTQRARHHLDHPPDSRLMKKARHIVATKHRNQHVWHRPRDHSPDTIRKSRARHAPADEEQRRYLTEGHTEAQRTDTASVHDSTTPMLRTNREAQPRSPRYADISPRHAFEQPRDPDEVAPATPLTGAQRHYRADTAVAAPSPPDLVQQPNARHQNRSTTTSPNATPQPTSRHDLRATAAEFIPRPPILGPTQIHGVQLTLRTHTPAIDHHLTRAATRTRDGHTCANHRPVTPANPQPASPRRCHANAATLVTPHPSNPVATRNRDRKQPVPPSKKPHSWEDDLRATGVNPTRTATASRLAIRSLNP
ncbi:hypothetical protein EDB84DRAFT_1443646 [Lactarius hengduanensis]|nr:hypothetical protein EDB84DRAFT_1443646 [Lactarius hengduanensis]